MTTETDPERATCKKSHGPHLCSEVKGEQVRAMSLLRVEQLEMQAPRSRPVVPPHRWRRSRRAYQNHKGKFPQHKISFPQTEVMAGYTMLIFKLLASETLCPSSSFSNEIIAGRTDKIGGREGPWLLTNPKHHHGVRPHFSLHFLKSMCNQTPISAT